METDYMPNAISPPCEALREIMDECGWDYAYVARAMDWAEQDVRRFMANEVLITDAIALRLCLLTAKSAYFWLQRQHAYEQYETIRRQKEAQGQDMCPRPKMTEILVYEDRRGAHIAVVKGNGKEVRRRLVHDGRQPLNHNATLEMVGQCMNDLERDT